MCNKYLFKDVIAECKGNLFVATLKSLAIMLLVTEILITDAETPEKVQKNIKEFDYTHCEESSPVHKECATLVPRSIPGCYCTIQFTLDEAMPGPVTLYYRLPNFDQTRASYVNSRDDGQLAGNLAMNVSSNCGNYSYDDTPDRKPIAPCGEIADSMFKDEFTLFPNTDSNKVQDSETDLDGVEEEKEKYRNPVGELETVFQNFSKPKSWLFDVTRLDVSDQQNNGFQNERFIAWMKTDLKTKPAKRFNNTGMANNGLAAGNYSLRIRYFHSKYITGPRIAIISSKLLATQELDEAKQRARNQQPPGANANSTNNKLDDKAMPVWAFLAIGLGICILQS